LDSLWLCSYFHIFSQEQASTQLPRHPNAALLSLFYATPASCLLPNELQHRHHPFPTTNQMSSTELQHRHHPFPTTNQQGISARSPSQKSDLPAADFTKVRFSGQKSKARFRVGLRSPSPTQSPIRVGLRSPSPRSPSPSPIRDRDGLRSPSPAISPISTRTSKSKSKSKSNPSWTPKSKSKTKVRLGVAMLPTAPPCTGF
jgi:hypothetical protein